jgi:hypothetical protein
MGFRLAGRTAATTATIGNAAFGVWNPHTTSRVKLTEVAICSTTAFNAANGLALRRSSARGTASTTVTPVIYNDVQQMAAPGSGTVLDLAYSAQPTLQTSPALWQWSFAAVANSGVLLPFDIVIPPSSGIALVNLSAQITPVLDVSVRWLEEW